MATQGQARKFPRLEDQSWLGLQVKKTSHIASFSLKGVLDIYLLALATGKGKLVTPDANDYRVSIFSYQGTTTTKIIKSNTKMLK